MKLIALHRIEKATAPGAVKEGEDGKPKVTRWAKHGVIKPGEIFEVDDADEDEIESLTSGTDPAAREATDRELKMADVGLIDNSAHSFPSTITEKEGEALKADDKKADDKKPASKPATTRRRL